MLQDMLAVIGFEVPIVGLMKGDQDGHDLTHAQGAWTLALDGSTR